jgi:hypothetical protein
VFIGQTIGQGFFYFSLLFDFGANACRQCLRIGNTLDGLPVKPGRLHSDVSDTFFL